MSGLASHQEVPPETGTIVRTAIDPDARAGGAGLDPSGSDAEQTAGTSSCARVGRTAWVLSTYVGAGLSGLTAGGSYRKTGGVSGEWASVRPEGRWER